MDKAEYNVAMYHCYLRCEPQEEKCKDCEEQMDALERASTNKYLSAEQYDILVSLYEQLKKLKGGVASMSEVDE